MLINIMLGCIILIKEGFMKFVNRQQEIARLNRLVNSEESGIAVIWGRRRVGKTRLLLE